MGRDGVGELLERERELASVDALLAGVARGEGKVALVEGAAGIGKTRLIAEVRRRGTDEGLRVLAARGGEFEREFAFGVVTQLFGGLAADRGSRAAFAGAAAGAWAVFGGAAEDASGDVSFAVLHGLYWLTVNLSAERPLLLAVDDLHWCDHASLRFFAYLARRLEGLPVLLACALRPNEPGVDTALVAEIAGDPLTVALRPGTLTEAAVAEVVRSRLGDGAHVAFAAACHRATGGNPLLLSELLKALDAEGIRPEAASVDVVADLGPRATSRAVLLRLARLSTDAAAVARAVAVLGDGAELTNVAALAELDEPSAARATGELVRAEILRPESPLGFVHPLVAAAVYQDVLPGERELRHEAAARLLAERNAPVEHVAAHLLPIPPRAEAWVVETLREAAGAAVQKGAPDSASAYLARALAEPPQAKVRPQLLLELGLAEALTSGPAAAEHLGAAYDEIEDPVVRALAAQVLMQLHIFLGSPADGLAVARRARAELPASLEELGRSLEAHELMGIFFGVGDDDMLRRVRGYRTLEPVTLSEKSLAIVAALEWAYAGEDAAGAVGLALSALAGGELLSAEHALFSTTASIVLALADRDEAVHVTEAALAQAHLRGSVYSASGVHLWSGFTSLRRGELAQAEEELSNVFADYELWGFGPLIRPYTAAFLATTLLERGDLVAARRALERGGEPDTPDTGVFQFLSSRVELLVAERRAEEALATAERLERGWGDFILNPAAGPWRLGRAQALEQLGRSAEALELARGEVVRARRWAAPWALGRSLRVLGTIDRKRGDDSLREAVDVLEGTPARLEHAKALAALGASLRRGRRPAESREPLRRALELADVCGAAGLADEVRSELHASGVRPRTTALKGAAALTASERRVAALAAEGASNREIAQALFVTPKTVEVHLGNAYRKLEIRSRRELPDALAGHER